jgi:hypothetical protein
MPDGTMTWVDAIKLSVPFVTAILMVWIKAAIESWLARRNKQKALSRVLSDELSDAQKTAEAFSRIAGSAAAGKMRLVALDLSSLIPKLAVDLAEIDATRAYRYAELASFAEIVNKGLGRLSAFTMSRVTAATAEIRDQIDRTIFGQAKITATDYVNFCDAELAVLNAIPPESRYPDEQAMRTLAKQIEDARKVLENWPTMTKPGASGLDWDENDG